MLTIIILVSLSIGLFVGYRSGFVKQLGSLISLLAALLACHLFGDEAAEVAKSLMGVCAESSVVAHAGASVVGNVVLFILVWAGLWFVARLIHNVIKAVHLGVVNSLLGAALMGMKVLILASLVLNLWVLIQSEKHNELMAEGHVVACTYKLAPALMGTTADINF